MSQTNDSTENSDDPCLHCGACCSSFRVSFYWAEADVHAIPVHAMEQLSPFYACMAGTNSNNPRCNALQGTVGKEVNCTLYAHRPSPCREVQVGDDKCTQARARHGLKPVFNTVVSA
ncbi:YkgJ family cysteine cluster protein [Undibacterium terreum]|uniref:YkgJ family cysteine cluster protein n=1 Tax=Undibacterium terreum TaxID=1224302 RepID=UPI001664A479|nr:YkgJ family cysteine cluster protein [Undibacterium terreum]